MAKLGEVCLLKAGKFVSANDISPEYNKGLYPCFGGNGIRGYVADYTHDGEFPLIGRQGALCGNVNLASGKFHATEHAVVAQPKIEMNVHWLYYALNAMNLGQYATGAAQPGLAVSKLETLSIEIPNISEQNKIAQTLYKVEQLVNFRKQQLAKLDELVKARFVEMFGDPKANCQKKKLSEIGNISTGTTPSMKELSYYERDDIPFIKPSDLNEKGVAVIDKAEMFISEKARAVARIIPPDAVLVTCIGTIGKIGIAKTESSCNQQINYIVPKDNINPIYLAYCLLLMKDILVSMANAPVVPIINKTQFSEFSIPISELNQQNQFATFVERVDQQKQTVQQSLEKLELLKKALMQEYFG